MNSPDVSFVIAAFDAVTTIEATIASALAQEDVNVEVVVIDDDSNDETASLVATLAAQDSRIVLLRQTRNAGPSAARNRGLKAARGAWIGILDSDDLLEPGRSRKLIELATRSASDMVADNVMRFLDLNPDVAWPLLPRRAGDRTFDVDIASYLRGNLMTNGDTNLGYLKPLFSRAFLQSHNMAYDESLRIGEDFNLVLRALNAGAKFTITTEPFYLYRIRSGSLSRSLRASDLEGLLVANDNVLTDRLSEREVHAAAKAYRRSAIDMRIFSDFRAAIRQRKWLSVLGRTANPRLWLTINRLFANARHRRAEQRHALR